MSFTMHVLHERPLFRLTPYLLTAYQENQKGCGLRVVPPFFSLSGTPAIFQIIFYPSDQLRQKHP